MLGLAAQHYGADGPLPPKKTPTWTFAAGEALQENLQNSRSLKTKKPHESIRQCTLPSLILEDTSEIGFPATKQFKFACVDIVFLFYFHISKCGDDVFSQDQQK